MARARGVPSRTREWHAVSEDQSGPAPRGTRIASREAAKVQDPKVLSAHRSSSAGLRSFVRSFVRFFFWGGGGNFRRELERMTVGATSRSLTGWLGALALLLVGAGAAPTAAGNLVLRIVHTNDMHSRYVLRKRRERH